MLPSAPSRAVRLGLAVALVAGVGLVDYVTGYQLRVALFYLVPILWITWTVGRVAGLSISLLSAATWLSCDLAQSDRYAHGLLPYWNALVTLGFFSLTVFLLAGFKRERVAARTCPLTGLLNRAGFFESAEAEVERCRRYARALTLAYFDCDGFKSVNDRWGHKAGDELLRSVGEVFRSNLRESDLFARLGGDEFAVLLPETEAQAGRATLEKLRGLLAEAMKRDGWPVTFSVGALTYLSPPPSVDEMLRRADDLLYDVKRNGRDGIKLHVVEEVNWPAKGALGRLRPSPSGEETLGS